MKLTQWEKSYALTIYESLFPSNKNNVLPLGAKDVAFGAFLDDTFENSTFMTAVGVRFALLAMQLFPVLFIGKLKLFKSLSETDKELYLEKWLKNKIYVIRQLALFVKMVGVFGYCGFPEVQRQMGIVKEKQLPPV